LKGAAMKLIVGAKLILVLLLIFSLDSVQYDAPALSTVEANPKVYAERYLTFKKWMRSSNDQRKILISGYLRLLELETGSLPQIPVADQTWAREIFGDTSHEELVPYINQNYTVSKKALRASGGGVETIVLQYVKNRLEIEKNYLDLLEVAKHVSKVKNAETKKASVRTKYDLSEYLPMYNNVFASPQYWFWYDGWKRQNQNEKNALVTGYMASLNEEIKADWCDGDEEKRRYDLFCKRVSVSDLVNHVDRLYKNPLYRDDDAEWLIYEYMIYNFQNYIGDPITLQG
jgi:hypothetical protein